jgi:hypothetical protein
MSKKPQGHLGGRSSVTGQFVPLPETYRRPSTTQREIIPNPGHGDSGRYPAKPKPSK